MIKRNKLRDGSMNKNNLGSISSSYLIDSKLEEHQLCGSKKCPSCGQKLDAKPDWFGLPAGVKFDPTDQELIEHLEAKVFAKDIKSQPLIDEFIPTIEGEDGICYTHPEKLPGVTRDGLSRHFFHRPSKAYTTGTRKRRKIQSECHEMQGSSSTSLSSSSSGETRWHKTGKTRPVMVNGKQKGYKKILVLYTNFGKNRKPEKTNWVMHQYHLGQLEEEKEGELVVSKIFYQTQPRQCNWSERSLNNTGEGSSNDHLSYRIKEGGNNSGSCSSKEKINVSPPMKIEHEVSGASRAAAAAVIPSYGASAIDHLSFLPFGKSFDEVGMGEPSRAREGHALGTCEELHEQQHQGSSLQHHVAHDLHHHHQHQVVGAAFNISRPSHPISTVISPSSLHQTSINILDDSTYNVPRIMLPNESFQTQEHQQHHCKMGKRSASGLEELIMGCPSNDEKGDSSISNPQEAEWIKYSTFWPAPDSDNQDHHG